MYARYFRSTPSKETRMTSSPWIRHAHRWLAMVFTLTVAANFIAMPLGKPTAWIVYSPLPPLFLLMFSGLAMFILPYGRKWRSAL